MHRQRLLTLWYITFLTVTAGRDSISVKERRSSDQETRQDAPQQMVGQDVLIQDDDYMDPLFRRESTGDIFETTSYVETVLSSSDNALGISLMELAHDGREKRAVHIPTKQWGHDIPYVIDSSYAAEGAKVTEKLKLVMKRIMDNVCVVYRDVTDVYEPKNKNWFRENGFESNYYILINKGSGCSTSGFGTEEGPVSLQPCFYYSINTHELLHTLGGIHTQQIPRRNNYITISPDNIQDYLQFTYTKLEGPTYVDEGFDSESSLLYSAHTWTRNGLETYTPIRDDLFDLYYRFSPDSTVFYELSKVFKCNELYCNGSQTDCGEGYHTLYMGVCQCVCPPEFDPLSNCKTLFNSPNFKLKWPNTPMAMIPGGTDSKCPDGFNSKPGWFTFEGTQIAYEKTLPAPLPSDKQTIFIPICTKDGPKPEEKDWIEWPHGGNFCFPKHKSSSCGGQFREATLSFLSKADVKFNGSLGDIDIHGNNITMKFCCKNLEHVFLVANLPNSQPFRLIATSDFCPRVQGMRYHSAALDFYTDKKTVSGVLVPQINDFKDKFQLHQCYYLPPVYGCNAEVVLNKHNKSVTITTPGFDGVREPNRRCLYWFKVPKNSKIRITFNLYNLDKEDTFLVKRYYKWQEFYRIDNSKYPYQFLSEGEYLLLEYWSSWKVSTHRGINFTADVMLPHDLCYNATTRGADYFGSTNISETYETCLPWSETTDCADFPSTGMTPIWLLNSGNECRNPDGELLQPWCYTHKNGTNCRKRYCDVCNLLAPADVLSCSEHIKQDPEFCQTAMQRFACFKSCGFVQSRATRKTCDPPDVPSDGYLDGPEKPTYLEGEKVIIKCTSEKISVNQGEMLCTASGWTTLESICNECPDNWVPYGSRCFFIPPEKLNGIEAEKQCQSYGPSGTLFQVGSEEDNAALIHYRKSKQGDYTRATWISGDQRQGIWYYTNTDIKMDFVKWPKHFVNSQRYAPHKCANLFSENMKEAGFWRPRACDRLQMFACQVDKNNEQELQCHDIITTRLCERTLKLLPGFCLENRFKHYATMFCRKSCGRCEENNHCEEPQDESYTRTSEKGYIPAGQIMTFDCKPGYYYVSGDLTRACSTSESFLGQEPVCQKNPVPVDVNLNAVIHRPNILPAGVLSIFNETRLRVPYDGYISKWYYYCRTPDVIYFLVYRQTQSSFTYVGSNSVKCQVGWKWNFNVPESDQIHVQKDDIFGVYSPHANTLLVNDCASAPEKIMRNPTSRIKNISEFKYVEFREEWYFIPSVGFHLVPEIF